MKKQVIIATLCGCVLGTVGLLIGVFTIEESDPDFSHIGYRYQYQGEPFSGIVYSLYPNHRPHHLLFFWQGKQVATELIWYGSGALMAERPYQDGKPDGQWKMWYENGNVKSLRTYEKGVITGEAWSWHPNGQVSDFNQYEHGQEITHKSWIADGTPYYNYVYQDGQKVGIQGGDFCKRLSTFRK